MRCLETENTTVHNQTKLDRTHNTYWNIGMTTKYSKTFLALKECIPWPWDSSTPSTRYALSRRLGNEVTLPVKVTPARLYSLEELSASKAWCGGCFNMFGSMVDNHPLFGHWTWVMFDITSQFHVEYGGHLCACCSLNYITFATTKPDYVQLCACLPSQGEQYCKWNVCRWAKLKASEVHSPGSVNPEKMKQQWNHQSGLIYI